MPRRCAHIGAAAIGTAFAGCGGGGEGSAPGSGHLDPGDSLQGQGVEIVDGRFVPDLVAVAPAQPVNFLNRDDVARRIVKLGGPGQDFRSPVLEPGESYRLSLVGPPGWKPRSGTVTYRGDNEDGPTGRIRVYGTVIPRRDAPERPTFEREPPAHPDRAAQRRARRLAAFVSQCDDFRRCDTPRELVEHVGAGAALRFVPGSRGTVAESSISTHGPKTPLGDGPDETEVVATRDSFVIVGHSRTGRDFVVEVSQRDPGSWTTRCAPAGRGSCDVRGNWK